MKLTKPRSENKYKFVGVIVLITLIILLLDLTGYLDTPKKYVEKVSNPIRYWVVSQQRKLATFVMDISKISSMRQENEKLKGDNMKLEGEIISIDELRAENELLRKQLSIEKDYDPEYIYAHIIGGDWKSGTVADLIIDKGSEEGVLVDNTVVYLGYLVGKVTSTSAHTSVIRLLNDDKTSIPVVSTKNGTKGLVSSSVSEGVFMSKVLQNETLEVDELIVTSGLGGYPRNLIIGKVSQIVGSDSDIEKHAIIKDYIDTRTIDSVFIISNL